MHIYAQYVYVCIHILCIYVHIYIHVHICAYICTYTYVHISIYSLNSTNYINNTNIYIYILFK